MTGPTTEFQRNSPAFREALLKSERLRIQIVIAAIVAAFAIRSLRTLFLFNRGNVYLWMVTSLFIAGFASYELWMLRAVNRTIQGGRELPQAAWIANVAVETCIPALALVFLSSGSIEAAYKPVANPAVLLYFMFIILSTLRLDPAVCRASGIAAAVTYLLAAAYLGWTPHLGGDASVLSPERAVVGFAFSFVVGGFVGGAVAGEIRKQVEAALREAEMKRQVERMEHDLKVARSIQQSLLPASSPEIQGFEIAGWNQPADDTGGDFYDWKKLPDGRWVLLLADVTGHGIGPAILASVCRAYSRASFNVRDDLETTVKNINHSFAEDLTPGRFATFVAAVCQDSRDQVELLSAGHGPLFVYSAQNQSFHFLEGQTLPLGILPDLTEAVPVEITMKPGDIILLITDGFFEWENNVGEQFGARRLAEVVQEFANCTPQVIIAELHKAVLAFAQGTKQNDDLTAVLIKRVAPETTQLQQSVDPTGIRR